jgi:4,5-DOPA dioxygenase extradiol
MDDDLLWGAPDYRPRLAGAAESVAIQARRAATDGRMPAIFLGHGAPPLVDDVLWVTQLSAWASALPRPRAILMVSAHWQAAPLTLGATREGTPLVYDFYGFPERYYRATYPAPAAPELARRVRELLLAGREPVADRPDRGLDHGAYVPLLAMYPEADVPVLQISMPSLEPSRLLQIGGLLRPLRDEGVLVIGSGFMTHGLPFLRDLRVDAQPPAWSSEFDEWVAQALANGDADALSAFRELPSARYAHPSTEHFVPLFVTLGTAIGLDDMATPIAGFYLGLSKRSIQVV